MPTGRTGSRPKILQGFELVRQQTSRIDLKTGVLIQDIVPVSSGDETNRVQILAAEGAISELVDVAIIAVGFGLETRGQFVFNTPAYWEDDSLDQSLGSSPEQPQRILIPGFWRWRPH